MQLWLRGWIKKMGRKKKRVDELLGIGWGEGG